jgi:hypothetical protein
MLVTTNYVSNTTNLPYRVDAHTKPASTGNNTTFGSIIVKRYLKLDS